MINQQEFLKLFMAWGPSWKYCNEVAFAVRGGNEQYWLRFHRRVYTRESLKFTPFNMHTRSIIAFRRSVEITSLHKWCFPQHVRDDPGFTEYQTMELRLNESGDYLNYYFEPMAQPHHEGALRLPTLVISAPQPSTLILPNPRSLQAELRAHAEPFIDVDELLGELGINTSEALQRPNGVSEIILAPPAELLHSSKVDGNNLVVKVAVAPTLERHRLAIGIRAFSSPPSPIVRLQTDLKDAQWEGGDTVVATKIITKEALKISADADIAMAHLLLRHDDEYLGGWWVADESKSFSERHAIQTALDQTGAFQKTFFDKPNEFEQRITLLASLLGLSPMLYGGLAALTDAPDLVAISPTKHLYVIECTTGDINNKGKMQKLRERTDSIKANLSKTRYQPTAIIPLIATSLHKVDTNVHWATAATFKIGLLCREDIEGLLRQIAAPPSAQALYDLASSLIPSIASTSDTPELPF